MYAINDPCFRCHCAKSKAFLSMCQGTILDQGKCPNAKQHWDYVSDREAREYQIETQNKRMHKDYRRHWGLVG